MEMKAEYSFGFKKKYNVTLFGDKCGRDIQALESVISSSWNATSSYREDWQNCIGQDTQIVSWSSVQEKNFQKLSEALGRIQAEPQVCEFSIYQAFQNSVLSQDFSNRYRGTYRHYQRQPEALQAWIVDMENFLNDWYSQELSKLNEYAFGLWAKAENIDEAYRLTLLPSFDNSQSFRIWRKDKQALMVYKEGVGEYDCDAILHSNWQKELENTSWEELQKFMGQHFWTSETWLLRQGNDGIRLLFEGWKEGQYKLLDDHSPEATRIPHQAWALFQKIKTQAISHLGDSEQM